MEECKRKLASIRKIASVEPIEGADNIELVHVDGWQCITKKGELKPGELCVYFEIDSFLPIRTEFEFLRKSSYKKMGDKEGFRLKTIRLRGKLSQGLALPTNILTYKGFDCFFDILYKNNLSEGDDVSEFLNVIKYDPPIPAQLAGVCKGNFPSFIRKTDQERVQNIWNKIKDFKETFEVTVKLDGTSCTYYLKDGVFGVCSRNLELIETEGNTLWNIARKIKAEETLRKYGKNIALQGEMTGEGIQGNPHAIKGQMFSIFDIWDIDNQKYLKPKERHICISHLMEIYREWDRVEWYTNAPIHYENLSLEKFNFLGDLLIFANGPEGWPREGLVFKSNDSDLTFKVISNEYLLKDKG